MAKNLSFEFNIKVPEDKVPHVIEYLQVQCPSVTGLSLTDSGVKVDTSEVSRPSFIHHLPRSRNGKVIGRSSVGHSVNPDEVLRRGIEYNLRAAVSSLEPAY